MTAPNAAAARRRVRHVGFGFRSTSERCDRTAGSPLSVPSCSARLILATRRPDHPVAHIRACQSSDDVPDTSSLYVPTQAAGSTGATATETFPTWLCLAQQRHDHRSHRSQPRARRVSHPDNRQLPLADLRRSNLLVTGCCRGVARRVAAAFPPSCYRQAISDGCGGTYQPNCPLSKFCCEGPGGGEDICQARACN